MPHWDWRAIRRGYARNRIEVAIWSKDRLCGLAIGQAIFGRKIGAGYVTLDRIEADPDPSHPLKGKIVDLAIACAEVTAFALGVRQVRIESPSTSLLAWYADRGYSDVVRRGYEIDYLCKDLPDLS